MNFDKNAEPFHEFQSCAESLDEKNFPIECVFKQLDPLFLIDPISQKLMNCTSLDNMKFSDFRNLFVGKIIEEEIARGCMRNLSCLFYDKRDLIFLFKAVKRRVFFSIGNLFLT